MGLSVCMALIFLPLFEAGLSVAAPILGGSHWPRTVDIELGTSSDLTTTGLFPTTLATGTGAASPFPTAINEFLIVLAAADPASPGPIVGGVFAGLGIVICVVSLVRWNNACRRRANPTSSTVAPGPIEPAGDGTAVSIAFPPADHSQSAVHSQSTTMHETGYYGANNLVAHNPDGSQRAAGLRPTDHIAVPNSTHPIGKRVYTGGYQTQGI
ncbi:hypothetical protein C8R44DRAFT_728762 [Mycena epipterygia]|nr:hypothetical protein C8R44DRAFT_728762 [Mycena epipterygia]